MKPPSLPSLRFLLAGTGVDICQTADANYALIRLDEIGKKIGKPLALYDTTCEIWQCPIAASLIAEAAANQSDYNHAAQMRIIADDIAARAHLLA